MARLSELHVYTTVHSAANMCSPIGWLMRYTVNSPNNRQFGARPTVRYSGFILYWGIIVATTFNIPCSKLLANIGYMGRANTS